jgi:phosphoglycerol transferase
MHRLRPWEEAGWATLTAALCGLFGLLVLQPWEGSLHVPYLYSGDANSYHATIKGILDHGWFWHNPSLGAPDGQQMFDFPLVGGDPLNVVAIKVLGVFSSDSSVVMNLFFLFTFPAVGLASYLVLRRLELSVPVAIACSILFALLPYHFERGEGHLMLSAYYAVPLGAYLVLSVLGERPLFAGRRGALKTVALCGVIAFASAAFYYSAFTVVLALAAGVLTAIAARSWRPLLQGAAVSGVIAAFTVVALLPSFVYWARHGTNPAVGHRATFESELYGLKFAQLVLPIEQHRIGELAHVRQTYDNWFPRTEAATNTALGVVAAGGFVFLLGLCFVQLAAPGRRVASPRFGQAGMAAFLALLFAWTGGLAVFVAGVSPQIRAWNRLSVFIGFFGLLAVGLGLERALAWLRPRRRGVELGLGAVLVVLAIGALDQTSSAYEPSYATNAADYRSDGALVSEIEAALPANALVFQLPFRPFPEAPALGAMVDYDLMRGYLHSHDLRWSYGAVKGRGSSGRNAVLAALPVPQMVKQVEADGFSGIYIDRFGYADRASALEKQLSQVLGRPPLVSPNGRLSFFQFSG